MEIQLRELMERVRERAPLVHHLTNYVTVNDCANMTLALGASPVMADDAAEAGDMVALADALVLNIGTLNHRTIDSMLLAGARANEKDIPVILDPVGCGATPLRTAAAEKIIRNVKISVVRGNISEVSCLAGLEGRAKGVDASAKDAGNDFCAVAKAAAEKLSCIAAVTGVTDHISDGTRAVVVSNGCAAMSKITGTGCMCSSAIGAFCGASPKDIFAAAAAAVMCMGLCGETAWEAAKDEGLGHFHMALFDAAGKMNGDILEKGAKWHDA